MIDKPQSSDQSHPPRLFALDAFRVFAIAMMIIYHFIYDLKYFGYIDWNTPLGDGFRQWRTAIVFSFVFAMGVSMGIAHGLGRKYRAFWKRLIQIGGCAALVSIMSLIMFPDSWIYFGILHFMVLAGLLTFTTIGKPIISLGLGILILFSFWAGFVPYAWPINLIPGLPAYTEDFVSPFPWIGIAFVSASLGESLSKHPKALTIWTRWKLAGHFGKIIGVAGKSSLSIYMIHQPILFGLIIVAGFLLQPLSS